jgi:hypothetical protein
MIERFLRCGGGYLLDVENVCIILEALPQHRKELVVLLAKNTQIT